MWVPRGAADAGMYFRGDEAMIDVAPRAPAKHARIVREKEAVKSARRGGDSRGAACRPRPVEVVAADRPERVEHLAAEVEPTMVATFHRAWIHFGETDAAAGHFRALVSGMSAPRELAARERV